MTFSKVLAIAVCSLLQGSQSAQISDSKVEVTVDGDQMTVMGSRVDHTTNQSGRFINPFHDAPDHVDQINYPDSKTFSVKLDTRAKKRSMAPLLDEDMDWITRAKNAFYG